MTIHLALERRISGDEALAEAKTLGIDCALERLQRCMVSEVDRRTHLCGPANAERLAQGSVPERGEIEDGRPASSDEVARKAC